jgi:tight adherence protein B
MVTGIVACSLVLLIVGYLVVAPMPFRLSPARRRPGAEPGAGPLTDTIVRLTGGIETILKRRSDAGVHVAVLERAGMKTKLQNVVLALVIGSVMLGAIGLLVSPEAGVVLALAVPLVARGVLAVMSGRRQVAFADQLDDTLQLMASSLRAGHSLLQTLAAVARDTEEPTSTEFSRVMNETRVGRELGPSLNEMAARMASEDFVWVTQAIAINREVGGNLAEVLDTVGHTIRERNQIRRQVKSLSAEGKLSAYVLIALPFGITAFLSVSNPSYMAKFTQSLTGYALIGVAVVLLVIGVVWLRRVVTFKF